MSNLLIWSFSKASVTVLERLEDSEHKAYLVGGCLRDMMMGREPHDFDIATSAGPETVMSIFSDFEVIPTGIKHGTVTVMVDGEPIEITTFRKDSDYSDGRRPDSITFTDKVEDDLSRRDFTINAMAFGLDGEIVDPFGGKSDIKSRVIRTVGSAEERFSEDGLRILRAIRFASVLGFTIGRETKEAIHKLSRMLDKVSLERVFSEMSKIILSEKPSVQFREFKDVFNRVAPELAGIKDFEHTLETLDRVEPELALRFTALLHTLGEEQAESVLRKLKSDGVTIQKVTKLVRFFDTDIDGSKVAIKKLMSKMGESDFFSLIKLKIADEPEKTVELEKARQIAERVIADKECFKLKDMAVKGDDLIKLGMAMGPEIGKTLNMLLDKVISEEVANDKDSLMQIIK
jgi:poly A polymerase